MQYYNLVVELVAKKHLEHVGYDRRKDPKVVETVTMVMEIALYKLWTG